MPVVGKTCRWVMNAMVLCVPVIWLIGMRDGCYYIVGRMGRFLKLFGMRIGLDECEQIIKGKYPIECACVGTDEKMTV